MTMKNEKTFDATANSNQRQRGFQTEILSLTPLTSQFFCTVLP